MWPGISNETKQLNIIFVLRFDKVSHVFTFSEHYLIFSDMKPFLFTLTLSLSALFSLGQYNIPDMKGELYCNHAKAAENQARYYYSPLAIDPLLEKYDVSFYFLDLEVVSTSVFISGNVTIQAEVTF